ncbi:coat protein F [Fischerella thermalis CCMEE 5273]|nr:coat protein F [Fischerella thermalis CCMEE 5273]
MADKLGAHEVLELHEIMMDSINGINQFELYRPHVREQQLRSILDNQIQFMKQEYNQLVSTLQGKGIGTPARTISTGVVGTTPSAVSPNYGLDHPTPQSPNQQTNQLDDRDIASGMLGCAKSSALLRMHGALECADPQIRQMVLEGAQSCANQAYEIWQYMNQQGYYQVPTLQANTQQTMVNLYQPTQQTQTGFTQ